MVKEHARDKERVRTYITERRRERERKGRFAVRGLRTRAKRPRRSRKNLSAYLGKHDGINNGREVNDEEQRERGARSRGVRYTQIEIGDRRGPGRTGHAITCHLYLYVCRCA